MFHASREISKLIGSRFHRKLHRIQRQLATATATLTLLQELAKDEHEINSHHGTTATQRLFEHKFPDLFEWLVKQMGDLPLPRKARSPSNKKLLSLQPVPA